MELITVALIVVGAIIFLNVFRKSMKQTSKYVEDVVSVNIAEAQVELIERAMEAKSELIEVCGENFESVDEVLNFMHKKKRRMTPSTKA